MVGIDGEERGSQIAQGDALQDRPDAQVSEAEHVAADGMVEPVDGESNEEQEHGALEDLPQHVRRGLKLRFSQ